MVEPIRSRTTLDPAPGARIGGKYEIDRLIARGGVGVVYLAHDRENQREVVIKFLAGHLTGESEASARFDREVERLSAIQHPNIVEVLGHGHENGAPYLVMEYLHGESLLTFLNRKGYLSLAEFVPIAAQILKALGYAHGRGLMHRDIKPANIMLITRKGRANFVKLLDFGMAKLVEGEQRDITTEQVLGTANYMAPEQVRGEPLDERVDVYACGLLFYRMLAGAPPFVADNNQALLYKQVHEQPAPLAVKLPPGTEVPPALSQLIDRCIAKDPEARPLDANALTEALVACVPSHLFRLPLAEGADPSATASTLAMVPDLAPSTSLVGRELPSGSMKPMPRKRRQSAVVSRSVSAADLAQLDGEAEGPSITAAMPTEPRTSSTRWIVMGAGALAAVVAAALMFGGGGSAANASEEEGADAARVAARLDQVDALILDGDFGKAREALEAVRYQLHAVPNGESRASAQERKIAVLIGLQVARQLEQAGDKGAADKAYRDVLALDAGNAEARAGLARVLAAARTTEAEAPEEPRAKARPRPKSGDGKPVTKASEPKRDDAFKLPAKKNEDSIFLPTSKK
ncbi:Protein kinase domain-containing protein [Nannocystis exedens]|uniref:non-specific serine/threonine protein kinase n=1 Tax=Nannocystis exedens TaxID=54 RepID=A0A1I1SXE1_9BACT|nr:serine/threonine-protein kinase [Nannocystis exedens]PCC66921.1 serine/threonine protein kinase [Nannocystis exedens]SFD51114.1 Protein kinase domain-containing protein [Nannocystis exedens]